MTARTYICGSCHNEYEFAKDWDALQEKDELFPDIPLSDCVMVCDGCFKALVPGPIHNAPKPAQ